MAKKNRLNLEVMQDLLHQLRGPIFQAEARARYAIARYVNNDAAKELLAIRGLCAKAGRVLRSTALLTRLHSSEHITINILPVSSGDLIRLIIELAQDAEILFQNRGIRCQVDRNSFEVLQRIVVSTDPELLGSAISNLVDNAFKYSYPNTTVEIIGGLTANNRFQITVSNTGIPLGPQEITKAGLYGWRGPLALAVTGEGSGICLWLSNKIMQALKGELLIEPTSDKRTKVSLILPTTQ